MRAGGTLTLTLAVLAGVALGYQCGRVVCAKKGEVCDLGSTVVTACDTGYCNITNSSASTGVCMSLPTAGDLCHYSSYVARPNGGECGGSSICEWGYCRARRGLDGWCEDHSQCSNGLWCLRGTCSDIQKANIGEDCSSSTCLPPLFCSSSNRCVKPLRVGESCGVSSAGYELTSVSNLVDQMYVVAGPHICQDGIVVERYTLPIGASCTLNSACSSGICGSMGKCVALTTGFRGKPCNSTELDCNMDAECICDSEAGESVCMGRGEELVDAEKAVYKCIKSASNWVECTGKIEKVEKIVRTKYLDHQLCSGASRIAAGVALLLSLVFLLL